MENENQVVIVENQVVVTDISMKFSSMVIFMIRWAFAAIPAFIIISIVGAIFSLFAFIFLSAFFTSLHR